MLVDHNNRRKFHAPGFVQQTLAGPETGLKALEVWLLTFSPGADPLPPVQHDSDVAWIILKGAGRAVVDGRMVALRPETTLSIPAHATRQAINTGGEELVMLAVRGLSPVPQP